MQSLVEKIISGGQCGADFGALLAAEILGIPTGGCAPKGFLTQLGSNPELGSRFGLIEHSSPYYPPRTIQNVQDSDATVRFARDFNSRGEKCTLRAIEKFKKPYLDVDIERPLAPSYFREFLVENKVRVLNVAGNTFRSAPTIEIFVKNYLLRVFRFED